MHRVLVRCTAFRVTSCVKMVVMYIAFEEQFEKLIRTFGTKCVYAEFPQVFAHKFDFVSTLSRSDDSVQEVGPKLFGKNCWYSGAMLVRCV